MKLARRLSHIEPFYVMECAKAAQRIAASPGVRCVPPARAPVAPPEPGSPRPTCC